MRESSKNDLEIKIKLICLLCNEIFEFTSPNIYYEVPGKLDTSKLLQFLFPKKVFCTYCGEDLSNGKFILPSSSYIGLLREIKFIEAGVVSPKGLHHLIPIRKKKEEDELLSYSEPKKPMKKRKSVTLKKIIDIDKTTEIYKLVSGITVVDEEYTGLIDEDVVIINKKLIPICMEILKIGASAVPSLISHLYEFEQGAAMIAVKLLGEIKDKRAIEPLLDALEYPYNYDLNVNAMDALVTIGGPVIDPLIQRILNRIESKTYYENKYELDSVFLFETIGRIHLPKAYSFLRDLLKNRKNYPNLELDDLIQCFSEQQNPAIIPELKKLVKEYGNTAIGDEANRVINSIYLNSQM